MPSKLAKRIVTFPKKANFICVVLLLERFGSAEFVVICGQTFRQQIAESGNVPLRTRVVTFVFLVMETLTRR